MKWSWSIKRWLAENIGELSEVSRRHRKALLVTGAAMLFLEPEVVVTIGKTSLVGIAISLEPPEKIAVSLILFIALLYMMVAFWLTALAERGVDRERAIHRALLEDDPANLANERNTWEEAISDRADEIVYGWTVVRVLWDFVLPNAVAVIAAARFLAAYLGYT